MNAVLTNTIHSKIIPTRTISLHAWLAGPEDGAPLILLHGFPDAGFGWEKQIHALAQAGFFVIAPDQRGYHLSDKPAGVKQYAMHLLVEDVLALADALGLGLFHLAGHDFGALAAWRLADQYPQRVKRLAILNVPHPRILSKFLRENRHQRRKSWYAFFFQLPFLPELVLRANDWKILASAMSEALSPEDLKRCRAAWAQPGALTAMLNWYRALFLPSLPPQAPRLIQTPTLMIWGKQDPYLMWQMAPESIALCQSGRLEILEDAGHWVHQDRPEVVNRLLIEHFTHEVPA